MAFCIDTSKIRENKKNCNPIRTVYFKRLDKEISDQQNDFLNRLEQRDWVPFEKKRHWSFVLMRIGYISMNIKNKYIKRFISYILDLIMQNYAKSRLIKNGVKTLQQFQIIYTTRLHAMILGVLMDKKIYGIDCKTRKISDYYNTWLFDCDKVEIFED